jgi:hypothetical protein
MDRKRKRKYPENTGGGRSANLWISGELRELNSRAWDGEKGL